MVGNIWSLWLILCLQGGDEDSEELWGDVDALVVVVGKDDVLYSKSTTLQVSEIIPLFNRSSLCSRSSYGCLGMSLQTHSVYSVITISTF